MNAQKQNNIDISVVIPVYNSENTIGRVVKEVHENLKEYHCQFILINDGSIDNSDQVCRELCQTVDCIYLQMARNYGEHNAVMAGLSKAKGQYTIIMDDDFQNPPSELIKMIDHIKSTNADVVYTWYDRKKHHWLRNLGSRFNHFISEILIDKPKGLYFSSFKILNHFLVQEIVKYQGPYPYIDGLIMRVTNKIETIQVTHQNREEGESGYTIRKLVHLWLNMSINFSVLPLRISSLIGGLLSIFGILFSLFAIIEKLLYPDIAMGWASTIVFIMVFSGIQLIILGIFGEYLGKLYLTANQTPQYTIRDTVRKDSNLND